MSVSVEDLVKHTEKDVIVHLIQEDGSLNEVEGKIKAASEAGVAFKPKGKSGVDLLMVAQIEEIAAAPTKPKNVTQKKIKPVPEGGMRQHLADRHGISLKWCKDNTEEAAVEFHNTLDHTDLGHLHVEPKAEETERQDALAEASA